MKERKKERRRSDDKTTSSNEERNDKGVIRGQIWNVWEQKLAREGDIKFVPLKDHKGQRRDEPIQEMRDRGRKEEKTSAT